MRSRACTMRRNEARGRSWSGLLPKSSSSFLSSCRSTVCFFFLLPPPPFLINLYSPILLRVSLLRLHRWVWVCGWPSIRQNRCGVKRKVEQVWRHQPTFWCWCQGDWGLDRSSSSFPTGSLLVYRQYCLHFTLYFFCVENTTTSIKLMPMRDQSSKSNAVLVPLRA